MVHACVLMDAKNTYKHTHENLQKRTAFNVLIKLNSTIVTYSIITQTRLTENQSNAHYHDMIKLQNDMQKIKMRKQKKRNSFFLVKLKSINEKPESKFEKKKKWKMYPQNIRKND